ncbi:MAG: M23 family metallopeptidase [Clostridiales bacterium]|nr:M23 family metallopeptidase [Clostridiales bacterium]
MNKLPEDSFFKKRGFFVALYSCVAVVLVLGGIITFNNIQSMKEAKNTPVKAEEPVAPVEKPIQKSAAQLEAERQAQLASEKALKEQEEARRYAQSQVDKIDSFAWGKKTEAPVATAPPATEAPAAPAPTAAIATEKAELAPDKVEADAVEAAPREASEDLAAPVFEYFQDGDKMSWPVLGEIVMDYSIDHTIYDKTLDQYRTNDNIRIAAMPGTPVKASASGVVLSVDKTRKDGNVIVIDNGNGWTTTYGQLMDSVLVTEGEVVKAGQVIGGVDSPTVYGVLLGNHLIFEVNKDDATVDPKSVLAERN